MTIQTEAQGLRAKRRTSLPAPILARVKLPDDKAELAAIRSAARLVQSAIWRSFVVTVYVDANGRLRTTSDYFGRPAGMRGAKPVVPEPARIIGVYTRAPRQAELLDDWRAWRAEQRA